MNVRPIQKPLGLAIGPLSVGVAEHEGHFYADVPPLRGIIYTDSESSIIDVSVDVAPIVGGQLRA